VDVKAAEDFSGQGGSRECGGGERDDGNELHGRINVFAGV
jgi:hypothetical protein